jgi:hypothetical protein
MTRQEWKDKSRSYHVRITVLHDKAQDSGLTAEETAELSRCNDKYVRLLQEFLKSEMST